MKPDKESLLSPYRVLDFCDEKGFLCGKILADLGAEVIKVEPPRGDSSRRIGPFYHDLPEAEKSLYWFAYNNNKKGITLNIEVPSGQDILRQLAEKADIIIESYQPGFLSSLGLGYDELKAVNPGLIMTSITPFGQNGPYSGFQASDLEVMAAGGLMSLLGYPDAPPVRVSLPQSYLWAGMYAAAGTLIALFQRGISGIGQQVDVSSQACVIPSMAHAPTFWDLLSQVPRREGPFLSGRSVKGAKMQCIFPCADGYLNYIIYGGPAGRATNQAITEWMNEDGVPDPYLNQKDWSGFDIALTGQEEIDGIEAPLRSFLSTKTKAEFLTQAIRRRMLGYPVATAEDTMVDAQLQAREFWQDIEHAELGAVLRYPGGFARFSETECRIHKRAPLIGEDNPSVYGELLGLDKAALVELKEAGVL